MKIYLVPFIIFIFFSCDPPRGIYEQGTIIINAQVINPQATINLGDSVAFYFEFPDSVLLNGNKIKITVGTNDGANNGFSANKIDRNIPGGFINVRPSNTCKLFANIGQTDNLGRFVFENVNGKFKGRFFIIPLQKGVYFFEQTQEGFADLNNKSVKVRFNFNFGNINRNHQMLIDSAGASNNFGLYLQGRQGLEVYGFKVN